MNQAKHEFSNDISTYTKVVLKVREMDNLQA